VARFVKRNQAGLGGEPDYAARPTFAAGAITARDEIAKCNRLPVLIGCRHAKE